MTDPENTLSVLEAKALALGRLHLAAVRQRAAAMRKYPELGDTQRGAVAVWILLEALVAHLEARDLTQKDLAARANGLVSAATVSRAIGAVERQGWIAARPGLDDHRLRLLTLTPTGLALCLANTPRNWEEFHLIAEAAARDRSGGDGGGAPPAAG